MPRMKLTGYALYSYSWDLRNNARRLASVTALSGVVQPHWESTKKLTLLEKKHLTRIAF